MLVDGPPDLGPSTVVLHQDLFLVGRSRDNDLVLDAHAISKCHARFEVLPDGLQVRDLGSTNGTFVNGLRIDGATRLRELDVVRFGNVDFRVATHHNLKPGPTGTAQVAPGWVSPLEQELALDHLLREQALDTHVQPIFDLASRSAIGFETLARPRFDGLPRDAAQLFSLAQRAHRAARVSALCRDLAVADADCRALLDDLASASPNRRSLLFSNVHDDELVSDELPVQIASIIDQLEHSTLVLEISERSLLQADGLEALETLRAAGVWIAFDDFGAGHDRLLHLASHPPDILKFDRLLIQSLRSDDRNTQTLLKGLVETARGLGCQVVAEGIETAEQVDLCAQIGFDLVQGYYFAMPASAKIIRAQLSVATEASDD